MIYPIYFYNTTPSLLVFNDVGLEIASHEFFEIENEDVLENLYFTGSEIFTSYSSGNIVVTSQESNPYDPQYEIEMPPIGKYEYGGEQYYQSVDTLLTRDSIPIEDRKIGLLVHVIAEDKDYRLVGGIENVNWVQYYPEHKKLGDTIDHPLATSTTPGFMSEVDKQILLNLDPGSINQNRYNLKEALSTTTSDAFKVYQTWNTNEVDVGDWIIRWMFKINTDFYTTVGEFIVELDGAEVLNYKMAPAYDNNEELGAIGVTTLNFATKTTHQLVVKFRTNKYTYNTRRTTRLFGSYLELIKVS